MQKNILKLFSAALILALLLAALPAAQPARAISNSIVISQVYGAGGNTGAVLLNDFVELFNRGSVSVSLAGWSVQYASAAGTGNFGGNPIALLSGTLAPGQYYLVQLAGGTNGAPLPTPDAAGTANMSGTAGKVALVNSTTGLACNGGSTPCSAAQLALIVDLVGYGTTANFFETAPAPAPSATTAILRKSGGCTETDNNGADFAVGAPAPRNTASPLSPCPAGDAAPFVTASSPANGALDVARAASVTITFSEDVTASPASFIISCGVSGAHTFTLSGGPATFTLDPDQDFAANETCTVTVLAGQVSDLDNIDPPDQMTGDFTTGFTTINIEVCGDPATPIHDVQGSGSASPLAGSLVSIEGVVVGDYQLTSQFRGYYVQEEDPEADADPATSEGIFVFNTSTAVSAGDKVRVRGTVLEFVSSGTTLTELTSVSRVLVCSSGQSVTPATVNLPIASLADWERYEGMLIDIPQALTATETFTLARFGEVSLAVNGRLFNPTHLAAPGAPALAQQDLNNRSRILLDDGNNQQNIDPTLYPTGGLSAANTLRSGYTVDGLTGVLDQRFGVYRVQPVEAIAFQASNPRPAAPEEVGGALKVASFNLLNYFNGDGLGGGFPTARGASTPAEFTRQRDKTISAITAIDAAIFGLMELENDPAGYSAIEDLVSGLNAATAPGTYAFIDTGVVGTDEIRVGLIYQPARVTPSGAYAILDSSVDPDFLDNKNRPALAQTFVQNSNGAHLTVAVNHLKSKGSDCLDVGDPDAGDGQGNCNLTRTRAAQALVRWLVGDPTGAGDGDFLIIGDLNSYALEDPITAIKAGGYTDLIQAYLGTGAYSYVFEGQSGYLDHALASAGLAAQATGATEWHINADEPIGLDYNVEFKTANQVITFYSPDPYRSSDHDPVIVGLDLQSEPPVVSPPTVTPEPSTEGSPVTARASFSDPGPGNTPFTCTVDYGDRSGPQAGVVTGDTCTGPEHAYASYGTYLVTVSVSDQAGATGTASANHMVIFNWAGFFQPVDNPPVLNIARAGSAIPVKFSLGGDRGLAVFATGSPVSVQFTCASGGGSEVIDQTVTAGGSSLVYDPVTGLYTYVWKTEKGWAGTCRQLVVTLVDGTVHTANFQFTK